MAENGVVLADHVLARLYQIERRTDLADERMIPIIQDGRAQTASLFAYAEIGLWQNNTFVVDDLPAGSENRIEEYAPFVFDLKELQTDLLREVGQLSGFFIEVETESQAQSLMSELDRLRALASEKSREIQSALSSLHGILRNKLTRFMFQHQQDTALIRFELGDFYLLEENYQAAIEQFQHVLAVDPWNTSANYKLGVVNQRAGNWSQAMDKYRQVYYADPRFENVAANYNYLARQNADGLSFNTHLLADTSRIIYHGDAAVTSNVTGFLGLEGAYAIDNVRIYQPVDPELPSTYQVHELTGAVALKLNILHLTLKPRAGAVFTTQLIEDTLPAPDDAKDAANILNSFTADPVWGADVLLDLFPFFLSGTYRYGRVQETYTPGRNPVVFHSGDANISLSLRFLGVPFLENSSLRTYGKIDSRVDTIDSSTNLIISAAQELNFVIHLLDNPWTNLSVVGLFVFENAKDPSVTAYYAPNGVILGKGGLTAATWIGIGNDYVLGLSARLDGGVYATEVLGTDPAPPQFTTEAEGRVELTRGDGTYYLSALYNGTFSDFPDVSYWSGRIRLGYIAKLPRLLAQ